MAEIIKKDDEKKILTIEKPMMSIAEKKAVAGIKSDKPITGVGGFVGAKSVSGLVEPKPVIDTSKDKVSELEIAPPDQDIKDMLNVIRSDAEQVVPESISPGMEVTGLISIDVKILKGLLQTVYTAPYFIYRCGKYEMSEFVSSNLDIRAQQLQTTLQLFGFVDPKYLVLVAFGTGFAMDMAMLIGDARELGVKAKEQREFEKQSEFAKMTDEQRDLQQGLADNKL